MTEPDPQPAPSATPDRMDAFTTEIAAMKLKTGRGPAERVLQVLSVVVMVGGIVLAVVAYAASLNVTATPGANTDLLDANSYEILAIIGLALTVAGGFGFLRYSLARFFRFWLLRQSYEQQQAARPPSP